MGASISEDVGRSKDGEKKIVWTNVKLRFMTLNPCSINISSFLYKLGFATKQTTTETQENSHREVSYTVSPISCYHGFQFTHEASNLLPEAFSFVWGKGEGTAYKSQ